MPYTTEKVGRTRTNIFDAETGEYVCQLLNKEVAGWLHRAAISEAKDAEHEIARRQYRIEDARAYLAKRAARLASALRGKWSNRCKAYIMSPTAAAKLATLYAAGKDAELGDRNGILDWVLE